MEERHPPEITNPLANATPEGDSRQVRRSRARRRGKTVAALDKLREQHDAQIQSIQRAFRVPEEFM